MRTRHPRGGHGGRVTPDFCELLTTVPPEARKGWVFRPLTKTGEPVRRTRFVVGPHVTAIGEKAGVIVGQRKNKNVDGETVIANAYAGAHDFRRSFATCVGRGELCPSR